MIKIGDFYIERLSERQRLSAILEKRLHDIDCLEHRLDFEMSERSRERNIMQSQVDARVACFNELCAQVSKVMGLVPPPPMVFNSNPNDKKRIEFLEKALAQASDRMHLKGKFIENSLVDGGEKLKTGASQTPELAQYLKERK